MAHLTVMNSFVSVHGWMLNPPQVHDLQSCFLSRYLPVAA